MLDLTRRRFIRGLGLVGIAPLIVKAGVLMPVRARIVVPPRFVRLVTTFGQATFGMISIQGSHDGDTWFDVPSVRHGDVLTLI